MRIEQGYTGSQGSLDQPIYTSPYYSTKDQSILYIYRRPEFDLFHFPAIVDIYCYPERIEYLLLDEQYAYLVEIYFLGWILAYWLERRGIVALHGAAVAIDGQAVVFLGGNHAGKSTLAAALMERGYALLSDDVVPIERRHNGCLARPGYPQMRMWPADVERFRGHFDGLKMVHPLIGKWGVPVGETGIGAFCRLPLPLGGIYLLDRVGSLAEPATITSIQPARAVIEVMRHAFLKDLWAIASTAAARFDFLSGVVERTPVKRLRYLSGAAHFPEVIETILGDIFQTH